MITVPLAPLSLIRLSPSELEVLVDNQCSVENVTRYGQSQGYKVEASPEGADFRLKLKK